MAADEPEPEEPEPEPEEPEPDELVLVGTEAEVDEPDEPEEPEVAVLEPELALELEEEEESLLSVSKVVGQVRLNWGVVLRSLVMANFMLLSGLESRRLYQKVGVLPKS